MPLLFAVACGGGGTSSLPTCEEGCQFEHAFGACVDGVCVMGECHSNYWDLNQDPADGCEYRCEKSADTDVPDLEGRDANCDGIDGELDQLVFLDPVGGNDAYDGIKPLTPVQTLDKAYSVAESRGRGWIAISRGNAGLAGDFRQGVNLAGGYEASTGWTRDAQSVSVIPVPVGGKTLSHWTIPTQWQRTEIRAADNLEPSGSSFALRLHQSENLVLAACRILAGHAGPGDDGRDGAQGDPGQPGTAGDDGCEDSGLGCANCARPEPGTGGAGCEGRNGGGGGLPGHPDHGAACDGDEGLAGDDGTNTPGGTAGALKEAGGDGDPGAEVTHGEAGQAGGSAGLWTAAGYTPADGNDGLDGEHGAGGGGGGGGGGGDNYCNSYGGAGGGGGGGGCGGTGGTGGAGGGSSVAIVLVGSSLAVVGGTIGTANGGTGGDGGTGGTGGAGGEGESGGAGEDGSGAGGKGGTGGKGGDGGHGGGGGGGPSVGIVCVEASQLDLDPQTEFTLGQGGEGGASQGDPGDNGIAVNSLGC